MTDEEKELLLKDLCARLPYNFVYCYCNGSLADGSPIILTPVVISNLMNATDGLVIKPYLRPMSSMTDEERKELMDLCDITPYETQGLKIDEYGAGVFLNGICSVNGDVFDWLNAHHFDYHGLIEKGVALEAPEGMYDN